MTPDPDANRMGLDGDAVVELRVRLGKAATLVFTASANGSDRLMDFDMQPEPYAAARACAL